MICYLCQSEAGFLCHCSEVYICSEHLGAHIQTGVHPFETLDITLSEAEFQELNAELLKRLNTIMEYEKEMLFKIKNNLQAAEKFAKLISSALAVQKSFIFSLFGYKKLCRSQKQSAIQILRTNLKITPFLPDPINQLNFVIHLVSQENKISSQTNTDNHLLLQKVQYLNSLGLNNFSTFLSMLNLQIFNISLTSDHRFYLVGNKN